MFWTMTKLPVCRPRSGLPRCLPWRTGVATLVWAAAGILAFSGTAHAQSAGCAAINGGSLNTTFPGGALSPLTQTLAPVSLESGERVTIVLTHANSGPIFQALVRELTTPAVVVTQTGDGTNTGSFTAPSTAAFQFRLEKTVSVSDIQITATCAAAPGGSSSGSSPGSSGSSTASSPVSSTSAIAARVTPQINSIAGGVFGEAISGHVGGALGGGDGAASVTARGFSFQFAGLRALADSGPDPGAARKPAGSSDGIPRWDVWALGRFTDFNGTTGADTDGYVLTLWSGASYRILPALVVGIAVGYERARVDTASTQSQLTGNGFAAGPYVGVRLTPNLIADAGVTYGWINYGATSGATTGSFEATRVMASANLTGTWFVRSLRLSPRVGLLYVREMQDRYTDSIGIRTNDRTFELGRFHLGPEIGYRIADGKGWVEPFAGIRVEYDFQKTNNTVSAAAVTATDRFGAQARAGVNLGHGALSGRLEFIYDGIGRRNYSAWSLQGLLRVRF